jgi:hypothetical protein
MMMMMTIVFSESPDFIGENCAKEAHRSGNSSLPTHDGVRSQGIYVSIMYVYIYLYIYVYIR